MRKTYYHNTALLNQVKKSISLIKIVIMVIVFSMIFWSCTTKKPDNVASSEYKIQKISRLPSSIEDKEQAEFIKRFENIHTFTDDLAIADCVNRLRSMIFETRESEKGGREIYATVDAEVFIGKLIHLRTAVYGKNKRNSRSYVLLRKEHYWYNRQYEKGKGPFFTGELVLSILASGYDYNKRENHFKDVHDIILQEIQFHFDAGEKKYYGYRKDLIKNMVRSFFLSNYPEKSFLTMAKLIRNLKIWKEVENKHTQVVDLFLKVSFEELSVRFTNSSASERFNYAFLMFLCAPSLLELHKALLPKERIGGRGRIPIFRWFEQVAEMKFPKRQPGIAKRFVESLQKSHDQYFNYYAIGQIFKLAGSYRYDQDDIGITSYLDNFFLKSICTGIPIDLLDGFGYYLAGHVERILGPLTVSYSKEDYDKLEEVRATIHEIEEAVIQVMNINIEPFLDPTHWSAIKTYKELYSSHLQVYLQKSGLNDTWLRINSRIGYQGKRRGTKSKYDAIFFQDPLMTQLKKRGEPSSMVASKDYFANCRQISCIMENIIFSHIDLPGILMAKRALGVLIGKWVSIASRQFEEGIFEPINYALINLSILRAFQIGRILAYTQQTLIVNTPEVKKSGNKYDDILTAIDASKSLPYVGIAIRVLDDSKAAIAVTKILDETISSWDEDFDANKLVNIIGKGLKEKKSTKEIIKARIESLFNRRFLNRIKEYKKNSLQYLMQLYDIVLDENFPIKLKYYVDVSRGFVKDDLGSGSQDYINNLCKALGKQEFEKTSR